MNEIISKRYTTVKEIADILDVGQTTVKRAIEKLRPVLNPVSTNTQGGYLLDEQQATLIKKEIQSHHNLASRQIDLVTTEQEENETILKAMSILKKRHDEYKLRAELAELKLEQQQPKVEFFDTVVESKSLLSMGNVAKLLDKDIGRNKLFSLLRDKHILMNGNSPYQTYIDRGYFKLKENSYTTNSGQVKVFKTPYVTQKGLAYIQKIVKEK